MYVGSSFFGDIPVLQTYQPTSWRSRNSQQVDSTQATSRRGLRVETSDTAHDSDIESINKLLIGNGFAPFERIPEWPDTKIKIAEMLEQFSRSVAHSSRKAWFLPKNDDLLFFNAWKVRRTLQEGHARPGTNSVQGKGSYGGGTTRKESASISRRSYKTEAKSNAIVNVLYFIHACNIHF
jgi:hypothetical protein